LTQRISTFALLLALALPVYGLALGANSIWDANEAFYVETPRQMIQSGDYLNPTFNGQPRDNKPVLSYWIVAGFYQAFGESVAVQRAAIACGALGTILATFVIGRVLGGPLTGVLAAVIIASAPRVVFFSRRIFIDVYITCFMAAALACFVLAMRGPHRRRYLAMMYVAIGLGILTKGPIALVLPGLVLLVWLTTERRLHDIRHLMIGWGALIVFAVAAPWWIALYLDRGWQPIYDFFITENFGRYHNAVTTERPVWFFLPVLFADILVPWAPLLLVPVLTYWRRTLRDATDDTESGADATRRLLWWWIVVIVAFFSLSSSKEDLYIYPVMPAGAALIAHVVVTTGFGASHRGVRVILALVAAGCVAGGAALLYFFGSGYYALAAAPAAGVGLGLAGAGTLLLQVLNRGRWAVTCLAAGLVVFNYLLTLIVLPAVEAWKPPVHFRAAAQELLTPAARVAFYRMTFPSLVYYFNRAIPELPGDVAVADWLNASEDSWLVTPASDYAAIAPLVPRACVVERHPSFEMRLRDILAGQQPPDVLLVRNRPCGS
jgi:4-amino-4-deoxy-L-arabinose transferase-like glycosyltransferase